MQNIWMNINYTLHKIKHDSYFCSLLIFSFSAMLLIPICIIGIGLSLFNFTFTYIPKPANQTISFGLQVNNNQYLESDNIKQLFPEIESFTVHNNKNILLWENDKFIDMLLSGINRDVEQIFRQQKVKGISILERDKLSPDKKYCWVGSDLYYQLGNPKTITVDNTTYWIAGVYHNYQLDNTMMIDANDFKKHHSLLWHNYSIKFKDKSISHNQIESFMKKFEKQLNIRKPISWKDWTEYEEHNKGIFLSVLGVFIAVSAFILIYGGLNILTLMINKVESQEQELKIQWFLGIPRYQLYIQEMFFLLFTVLSAALIDLVALLMLKNVFIDYLKLYIVLDIKLCVSVILFAVLISVIISFVLLKKRLKILAS
ncbi:hypothetical protein [Tuanshanicoccus lijuaniae]|uniref:hypothetical protein n=1 Tax=Aerococcaceae bacterium zg-1292 TaxID=2774330 RepID=UPI001BD90EB3|nr:hypothetical protein [Aerococcaceae bacterium zg-A91]MBS4457182.1 hypothetical protein [Aerococcaceae bacterium zg-BR33]